MRVPALIQYLERRVVQLNMQRTSAESLGDIGQIEKVDIDIAETQDTINKLRTLPE